MSASGTLTRILIGAGSFADARTAIRLAGLMAESLTAEMGGILIDETLTSEIVQLPGQRVVTSTGMLTVAPTIAQFRTLIESDAKAFSQTLAGVARSRTLKWSFELRKGDLIHGLCEAAKGWDILLLGYRAIHKRPGRVIVIRPALGSSQEAEKLAGTLAQVLKTEVVALFLGTAVGSWEGTVSSGVATDTEDKLLAQVNRINAAAVVVDLAAGPLHTHDHLRQLLNAARCPVVVLGAARGEASIEHSPIRPPKP